MTKTIALLSLFLLPIGIALAEDIIPTDTEGAATPVLAEETTEPITGTERDLAKNPCSDVHGVEFRRCILENNKLVSRQEARRSAMLQRRRTGRRIEALKARQEQVWSTFDSPTSPGPRIDLREQTLPKMRTLRDWNEVTDPASTTSGGPAIRIRAKAGRRNDASLAMPVCSMRHGARLVTCLRMMNIPIIYPGTAEQPATVDQDTWDVYERMYTK